MSAILNGKFLIIQLHWRFTFGTDEAPSHVEVGLIAAKRAQVWGEVFTADYVQATQMLAAGGYAQVVGMIRRRTAHTSVHSTYSINMLLTRRRLWECTSPPSEVI